MTQVHITIELRSKLHKSIIKRWENNPTMKINSDHRGIFVNNLLIK